MLSRCIAVFLGVSLLAQRLTLAAPMYNQFWESASNPRLASPEEMLTSSHQPSSSEGTLSLDDLDFVNNVLVDPQSAQHQNDLRANTALVDTYYTQHQKASQVLKALRQIPQVGPKRPKGFEGISNFAAAPVPAERVEVQKLINSGFFQETITFVPGYGNSLPDRHSMRDKSPLRRYSRRLPPLEIVGPGGAKKTYDLYVTEHEAMSKGAGPHQYRNYLMFWSQARDVKGVKHVLYLGTGYMDALAGVGGALARGSSVRF
ncbi:hypothetical protein EX895_004995 [Sporisorium graminicola]|uniref:Uncharacterized protein n=1 Tax=Sporisorium graminicola TaxID=280036 RepID=A0A4U7KP79_9BASI|nr:hypothetical protein EX895_004995 [Sporisorium graminicola]TKY86170.1 hypothetical protein EX895_004995 [Sporisorium graminicola]